MRFLRKLLPFLLSLSLIGAVAPVQANPPEALETVVAAVRDSVVGIQVLKRVPPDVPGDPYRIVHSSGSGFVISEDGYVLSNAHVLDHALVAIVETTDGKKYGVAPEKIWADPVSDIAVAKVDAKLKPVTWASSSGLKLGEPVFVMGAPYGPRFQGSISRGVLSGLERNLDADYTFLQTDAPINPGNSGGPLFNAKGEVIGVNARGITSADGMGFSIPSDVAKAIAEKLIKDGKVVRAWLGLSLSDGLNASLGWPGLEGPMVAWVDPQGPAKDSGILAGDVLVKLNGTLLADLDDVSHFLNGVTPGTPVSVTFDRGEARKTVTVTLGSRPHDAQLEYPSHGLWSELNPAQQARAVNMGSTWSFLEWGDLFDSWVTYQGGAKAILVTEYMALAQAAWEKAKHGGKPMTAEEAAKEASKRSGILEIQVDLPTKYPIATDTPPWAEWRDAGGTVKAISVDKVAGATPGYQRLLIRLRSNQLEKTGSAVLIIHTSEQTDRRFQFVLDWIH